MKLCLPDLYESLRTPGSSACCLRSERKLVLLMVGEAMGEEVIAMRIRMVRTH